MQPRLSSSQKRSAPLAARRHQVVGIATLVNPSPGTYFFGSLALEQGAPFRRVTVRPEGCAPANPCGPILNVDDLTIALVKIFAGGFRER